MTIREMLARFEGAENIVDEHHVLDVEIEKATWLAFDNGALQVCCGGEAVVSFKRKDNQREVLLVIDDTKSYGWESSEKHGPKPWNRLVLKQTA